MGKGKSLQELLAGTDEPVPEAGSGDAGGPKEEAGRMPAVQERPVMEDVGRLAILEKIEGIEIEAVVGGALQRIRFKAGSDPSQIGGLLRLLDAKAEVRTEFPKKSFGSRETKTARALVLNVRVSDSGKFIDMICQNGEDLSVSVSKKQADTFLDSLKALGRVGAGHLDKIAKAFVEKGSATVILPEPEQFGVQYWTTDDGRNFLESMVAEPPTAQAGEVKSHE